MSTAILGFLVSLITLSFAATSAQAARGHVFETTFGSGPCTVTLTELCEGKFTEPAGVAVNEATHDVYVADKGNNRIEYFTEQAGKEEYVGQFAGPSATGEGMVLEGSTTIELVSTESGTFSVGEEIKGEGIPAETVITHIAAAGTLEISNPVEENKSGTVKLTASFVAPEAIAVDNSTSPSDPSKGDVYVSSGLFGAEVVNKFSPTGSYIGQIDETIEGPFSTVRGVAVDAAGQLWVDGRLTNQDGIFGIIGNFSNGEVDIPEGSCSYTESFLEHGLAVDSNDDLYIDTEELGVVELNKKCEVLDKSLDQEVSQADGVEFQGVATEAHSNDVYIDNAESIGAFSSTGSQLGRFGERHLAGICEVFVVGAPLSWESTCQGGLGLDSSSGRLYAAVGSADRVVTFGLEQPASPKPESASVTELTDDSATLNAEINPRSIAGEAETHYYFEYGACDTERTCLESPYTVKTSPGSLAPSFEVESIATEVQGLSAGTTYHFRVLAENASDPGHPVEGQEQVFSTRGTGPFSLPDSRKWVLVSPPNKNGALIEPIGPGLTQAAADGDAITYEADAPTERSPAGFSGLVQVLSTRGPNGWSTKDIAVPHISATGISVGSGNEYRFFSEDLSAAVVQPFGAFDPALSSEASEQTAFLHTDFPKGNAGEPCVASCYRPLVTGQSGIADVPEPGTTFGVADATGFTTCPPALICGPVFVGATPGAHKAILSSEVALTSTPIPVGGNDSLYEWDGELPPADQIQLISVLPPNGERKELPAIDPVLGAANGTAPEAPYDVSSDGSRIFFSSEGHLYMRDLSAGKTMQLDVPDAECVETSCGEGVQDPEFQLASSRGDKVFFSDTEKLTPNGRVYDRTRIQRRESAADLYECEVKEQDGELDCALRDLTPAGAQVGSVLGASQDGDWIYFVANGTLAPGAVKGGCPDQIVPGTAEPASSCNLYVRHGGATRLVAILSNEDISDWSVELAHLTARVSPNGEWLAFMSQGDVTGYDNRDAVNGKPDQEVYLYHAPENLAAESGALVCASCDPTGARPHGVESGENGNSTVSGLPLASGGEGVWSPTTWIAANVPPWTRYTEQEALYQSRYLSDQGRLFFDSGDGLVPKDVNGTEDVYEYEPEGVPSGEHACSSASTNGSDVFEPERTVEVEGREVTSSAGCVALISSGSSAQESAFLDASAGSPEEGEDGAPGSKAGGDVFFLTTAKLAPQDLDTAYDIYDAQECTSAVPCPSSPAEQPPACATEASCKAAPAPPPQIFGAPPSVTFNGPGDAPSPTVVKPKPKPTKCRKGAVKNHKGKCTRKKTKKQAKRSSTNRGTK
jgi:hypothetical protein